MTSPDRLSFDSKTCCQIGWQGGTRFLEKVRAQRPQSPRLYYVAIVGDACQRETSGVVVTDALTQKLSQAWPQAVPGFHQIEFAEHRATLILIFHDPETIAGKWTAEFDELDLRGAGSLSQRALLSLIRKMKLGARLFVEGDLPVNSRSVGLVAEDAATWVMERAKTRHQAACAQGKEVLVIGGGLAGANVAYSLNAAGFRVQVIDEGCVPGAGASALAWGILHPHFSRDDNILSRLSREGFLATAQRLKALEAATGETLFAQQGCLQMAHSDAIFQEWQTARANAEPFALPSHYARLLTQEEASAHAGLAVRRGGWWFPMAGMVRAGAFCRALIAFSGVRYLGSTRIERLERRNDRWIAVSEFGVEIASGTDVVVANAADAARLLGQAHLPLDPLRGRITLLRDTDLAGLKAPVSGEGYVSNLPDGVVGIGATYERDDWPEVMAHEANLDKLGSILLEEPDVIVTGAYQGVRAVGSGRIPYVGAVCDEAGWLAACEIDPKARQKEHPPVLKGLWICAGMGSRGISFTTLCSQILVAQMAQCPMPIDDGVIRALSPDRVLKKTLQSPKK